MKKQINYLIMLIFSTMVLSSCKKENAEFATFRCTISVDGEKRVEDYVSEENRCTYIGYSIYTNGDTLSFFRQIDGCFGPISIETAEGYTSPNKKKMHFEGNKDNGLTMFISGGENYPTPDFIWGELDLIHSDDEYIEGTFSGAFFRNYVFVDGDHSNRDYVKDTIWVEDGYFKVSVTDTYDRSVPIYE